MGKIDTYSRTKDVDRVYFCVLNLVNNNSNVTFALNGDWGCGKTFLLEELSDRLNNEDNTLVIKYNAWEYDYYDEPLVSLLYSIINSVNEKDTCEKLVKTLGKKIVKSIVGVLVSTVGDVIKNKTGIDVIKIGHQFKAEYNNLVKESLIDNSFNPNDSYEKAKKALRHELSRLSEHFNIVLIVDELDRCLPDYAIKVLERLHHINSGIPKTQTIVAFDKDQLKNSISNIYGPDYDIGKYLAKFFSFSIDLDQGMIDESIFETKSDYFNMFDACFRRQTSKQELFQKMRMLLKDNIRENEEIINYAHLIHKQCFPSETKMDYSLCFLELLLSFLSRKERKEKNQKLLYGRFRSIVECETGFEIRKVGYKLDEVDNVISFIENDIIASSPACVHIFANHAHLNVDGFDMLIWLLLKYCRNTDENILHRSHFPYGDIGKKQYEELCENAMLFYNTISER